MRPLRSVVAKLSFALALVVAGALAVVWLALVPTLQRRLVAGKQGELVKAAQAFANDARTGPLDQRFVDEAAHEAISRLVVFDHGEVLLDSAPADRATPVQGDPLVRRAAARKKLQRGTVSRGGVSYAEVAVRGPRGTVLLFTASLRDTLRTVVVVRSRLLVAGLIALGLAVLVGIAAASAFARRIRRLERAADRIAAGDFAQPVVDHAADELGELAAAFDRMRQQLARLDGARRAFIANASHELRTPIFSLGGFLELLEDEELDEQTRAEFLGTMSEQVARLSKLATDLLDLSRLDAGGMSFVLEPVALGELVGALADEFAALARKREHPLEAVAEGDGTVLGDRERVLQIGRALIDNALLHTPPGTRVRVVARGATLAVEDDGPGIPAEQHEQVFARFTRLDGSRASGTGLGLAIASELAERMGGSLRLESVRGRTSFTLVFP
ncbi:MAG: sensor histidine kinase [Gaiellaceae bacterium]